MSLLCHLAFWFGPLFATPVFVALHNPEDVAFPLIRVIFWTSLSFLVLGLSGWKAAQGLPPRVQWWLNRLLLSVALVTAVQSNVIHELFYYGAFNGQRVDFRAYGTAFHWEYWGYFLAFPVFLFLLSRIRVIPAWLASLPILSFCVLLFPALFSGNSGETTAQSTDEIDPSVFAFSTQGNLIHLLPDGFQGDVVREVLEENADLAVQFQGFTLYTDHVGLYQGTAPALYTILTGEPFPLEKGYDISRVTEDVQARSYQNQLVKKGYQLDYVPISGFICIEEANSCHARPFNDMKARGYYRHHNEDSAYSIRLIADLSLFRLVPMYLKEKIYDKGNWFLSDTTLDGSSPWPDPVIHEWVENFHLVDDRPVYKWYHFMGTHIPAKWDAQCKQQRDLDHDRENYKAQAICVLRDIGRLLGRLKEAGIYDQTAIVISGDHGHNIFPDDMKSPPLNGSLYLGLLGSGRPTLLVKQKNTQKALQFSNAPTSLVDVAPTALALAGIETPVPNALSLQADEERDRYFTPYSIPDLRSGESIPYVRYRVEGAANDGEQWVLADIRRFREAPSGYDPVNLENSEDYMLGATFDRGQANKESSWIVGRQLGFLMNLPDLESATAIQLTLHLPEWIPQQTLQLELNNFPAGEPLLIQASENFWQEVTLPMEATHLKPGRNFISIRFEQTFSPPERTDWRASALIKSIRVSDDDQEASETGRLHQ